jgi:uncharacterized glyoxalase superfamily protein PhnB
MNPVPTPQGHVVATMRYRDPAAAIKALCSVFGFTRHAVYEAGGTVAHAELTLGAGMVMLGGIVDNEYGKTIVQPDEIGMRETQAPYLIVADADAVYSRAREAGFTIVRDIRDEDYGGRGFTCRDHEGHLWSVGTYDPWVAAAAKD